MPFHFLHQFEVDPVSSPSYESCMGVDRGGATFNEFMGVDKA